MQALVLVSLFLQNIYTCYNGNKVQTQMMAEKVDIDRYLPLDEELDIVEFPNCI